MLMLDERMRLGGSQAIDQIDKFFGEASPIPLMRHLAAYLKLQNVPYAVMGGMARVVHGCYWTTTTLELLVRSADQSRVQEGIQTSERLGFDVVFRIASAGIAPTRVCYPDPEIAVEIDRVLCLPVPKLVEVSLAQSIARPQLRRNQVDVMEMIQKLNLPRDLELELNADVRAEYRRVWDLVRVFPEPELW